MANGNAPESEEEERSQRGQEIRRSERDSGRMSPQPEPEWQAPPELGESRAGRRTVAAAARGSPAARMIGTWNASMMSAAAPARRVAYRRRRKAMLRQAARNASRALPRGSSATPMIRDPGGVGEESEARSRRRRCRNVARQSAALDEPGGERQEDRARERTDDREARNGREGMAIGDGARGGRLRHVVEAERTDAAAADGVGHGKAGEAVLERRRRPRPPAPSSAASRNVRRGPAASSRRPPTAAPAPLTKIAAPKTSPSAPRLQPSLWWIGSSRTPKP